MEIRLMGANDVLPTLTGYLMTPKLYAYEGAFNRGRHLDLEPTSLVRTPSGLLLTDDGHHRLTQAMLHGVEIWNKVHSLGDAMETPFGDIPVDELYIRKLERVREIAVLTGHATYMDLYRHSFKVDWNTFPFNQIKK